MPTQEHEALVHLFRNSPNLAPKLMRDTLGVELPAHSDVKIACADLTEVQPTEYRADLVLSLSNGEPAYGLIVEVQLSMDARKRFVWPAYVASLRARWRCPVCLLVVCADSAVARWAAKPIQLGCKNLFAPKILGPDVVPEILDAVDAEMDPELAVLSAMAHGHDADVAKAARIAALAQGVSSGLDDDRSKLYLDLVINSVSEAVRKELAKTMLPFKYEYQSDFAKHYVAEGLTQGRVALITRLLAARFGSLSDAVRGKIAASTIEELDAIGDRLLTAASLQEALAPKS
ncbi:DUF4351 domain-containing protein [Steroidobacter agaridevorans]|uniref:DUF4351 domain-containing protein n=1 Tax=Steroidobacter agaridevorans TaxID=2695856 RepID=UPI0013794150|nr:DUF4351 domain-containing protein [Steroidobacter agaridevorans]